MHVYILAGGCCCIAGQIAVVLGLLPMVLLGLVVLAVQSDIGRIFTGDASITAKVSAVVPVCAAYLVIDAVGNTSAGVLR